MKKAFSLILLLLVAAGMAALYAQTTKGILIAVHDGDSFEIRFSPDSTDFIRLAGCDAPEVYSPYVTENQPYGKEAGQLVREKLKGQTVLVEFLKYDQYGRPVCNIYHESVGDLAYYLVLSGGAWWVNKSISKDKLTALKQAQDQAKEFNRGLWGKEPYANYTGQEAYPHRPDWWRAKHRGY